jgi:hypothetical protein
MATTAKPATKKVATTKLPAITSGAIEAYSMKHKQKVEMFNATVSETPKGSWIAKGQDFEGNNISVIMSKDTALAHVKAKRAKKA